MKHIPIYWTLLVLFIILSVTTAKDHPPAGGCTEYSTKTVKYVYYSTSSVFETDYVVVHGKGGGTATVVVTSYAPPVTVTVDASTATSTVTEVVLSSSTVKGSAASTTVTTVVTDYGATATTFVTETITVAATETFLLDTDNAASPNASVSFAHLAMAVIAGAAILLIQ